VRRGRYSWNIVNGEVEEMAFQKVAVIS
jgi:hypothetical protein